MQGNARAVECGQIRLGRKCFENENGSELLRPLLNRTILIHKGENITQEKTKFTEIAEWLNLGSNSRKCLMQGKGVSRHPQSASRGGTTGPRPSQASSQTHFNAIMLEYYVFCKGLRSVGVWCMCALTGVPEFYTRGWKMNALCWMGHLERTAQKVSPYVFGC